jgi:glycine betaine catabolism B
VSSLVLRVKSVRRATPSTRIVRADLGGAAFPYKAGQAALVGPPEGAERVPYSIASAPEESRRHGWLEFLIKTDASGHWGTHFPPLRRGMQLAVKGPLGSFKLPDHPRERKYLFIAGGTGISPIRSMIREAILSGRAGRIRLLYSARTPGDFAYATELRSMARRGEIELALATTREIPARWRGWRGRISAVQLATLIDDPATLAFVCGPAAMVADVPPMLQHLGIDQHRIRVEQWAS